MPGPSVTTSVSRPARARGGRPPTRGEVSQRACVSRSLFARSRPAIQVIQRVPSPLHRPLTTHHPFSPRHIPALLPTPFLCVFASSRHAWLASPSVHPPTHPPVHPPVRPPARPAARQTAHPPNIRLSPNPSPPSPPGSLIRACRLLRLPIRLPPRTPW